MGQMAKLLQRECVYLWYYFDLQLHQIFPYWVLGILLGSAISVFLKESIHNAVRSLGRRKRGVSGVVLSSLLGIASPLCMYGTIPLLQQWLWEGMSVGSAAAFMLTGPATKITNLGALKIVLRTRHFCVYLVYITAFSLATGWIVNIFL